MSAETNAESVSAVGLLDEPIRRRLYEWVVAQGDAVGREHAARELGIGRALAAFHLEKLVSAGLLDAGYKRLGSRRGPGAGRPARVYWRGQREFAISIPERRYERAAEVFAVALERLDAEVPLHEAAREIGQRLAGEDDRSEPEVRLLRVLAESGYEPVEDDDKSIRLRNCPFHSLVHSHRDLVCGTNLALAEGIVRGTGAAVTPQLDPQEGFCCVAFRPRP